MLLCTGPFPASQRGQTYIKRLESAQLASPSIPQQPFLSLSTTIYTRFVPSFDMHVIVLLAFFASLVAVVYSQRPAAQFVYFYCGTQQVCGSHCLTGNDGVYQKFTDIAPVHGCTPNDQDDNQSDCYANDNCNNQCPALQTACSKAGGSWHSN